MAIQLGDIATWVASVGTVAAVGIALQQILSDKKERLKREFREQAELISAWYAGKRPIPGEGPDTRIEMINSSHESVYEVIVGLTFIQGAAPRSGEEWMRVVPRSIMGGHGMALGTLPPGQWFIMVPGGWRGMYRRPGAEIAFTDRAGSHWVRRASGKLEQLDVSPLDHYGIGRPVDYQVAEPVSR